MSEEEGGWKRCWDFNSFERHFSEQEKKDDIFLDVIKKCFNILKKSKIKIENKNLKNENIFDLVDKYVIIDIDDDFDCKYKKTDNEFIYKFGLSELGKKKVELLRSILVLEEISYDKNNIVINKSFKDIIAKDMDIGKVYKLNDKLLIYLKDNNILEKFKKKYFRRFKEKYGKIENYPTETIIIKKSELEKKQKIGDKVKIDITFTKKTIIGIIASSIIFLHTFKF